MTMIIHKVNLPDIDIDQSSFVYEGDFILIQDEYISGLLKLVGVSEIGRLCYSKICYRHLFSDYPEVLELYSLKSSYNAYHYSCEVLKGRFKLGEPIIATNARFSYWYAREVLKGRFELGEQIILSSVYKFRYIELFLCQ